MSGRVAYLVSRFPKVSETFIVDEIRALERRGRPVSIYTLARGRDAIVHPEAEALAQRSICLSPGSLEWLGALGYWAVASPLALACIWLRTLSTHARKPRQLVRAVVALAHAGAFARRLAREGVVHLHAHWATHTALAAWAIHRLSGLPYSFTAHADDIYVRRPMLAEKVGGARFVATISEYNRSLLIEQLGPAVANKIRVVRCGVETHAFEPLPLPSPDTPLTLVCVARLEEKKGHRYLLDACARLVAAGRPLRCLLVGDGALKESLAQQVRAQGLERCVEFLGARAREGVRDALAQAHLFVLPSIVLESGRADGIPVAMMEALAVQRAVVASSISGLPELIEHEVTGLLTPPRDADALAAAIARLGDDPALAAELASAGRARVCDRFDVDRNAALLSRLFDESAARGAYAHTPTAATAAELAP